MDNNNSKTLQKKIKNLKLSRKLFVRKTPISFLISPMAFSEMKKKLENCSSSVQNR